ncbi:MAG TPA: DUF2911 domain-containing protein [Terriglobales bacterium]|nr:DUF2911 domain-containing protein [Terriglobales bacterium]
MPRRFLCLLFLCTTAAFAVDPSEPATTVCTLEDGQEMSVRYTPIPSNEKLPNGKVWTPAGSPMLLFTSVGFVLNNAQIPAGAYSLYIIPGNGHWTLIVNKNVTAGSKYDEHEDIVRAPMDLGQVGGGGSAKLDVAFAHMGPKLCNIRIYYGKVGAWADIKEQ